MADEVPHDGEALGEIVARGNVVMKGYFQDRSCHCSRLAPRLDAYRLTPLSFIPMATSRSAIASKMSSSAEAKTFLRSKSKASCSRHPAVQEAAVVGMPHEKWGEAPHAFVVLKNGAQATETELREFARAGMAHFKVPASFTIMPELPKTATGKIKKYVLRRGQASIAPQ